MKNKLPMLSRRYKILFAIGGIGENIVFQAVSAWLFFFWAGQGDPKRALIPIGTLGLLIGLGRFIEAFDDPFIGHLSDRTKSRWGKRFPFVFFGAPFLALSFVLLWMPPTGSTLFLAGYFFLALQFFFLTYTLVSAPYEGILPELAKTSFDRVSASAWRVLFGVIGAGVGLIGSSMLIQNYGFAAMGIILGILTLVSFWVSILGIRKRLNQSAAHTYKLPNFYHALLITLKNKQFIIFSLAFILFSLGFNMLNSLLPFYVKGILQKEEAMVGLFSALVLVSMLVALPVQTKLSARFGKKKVYAYSMLALGIVFPLLAIVGFIPIADSFIQTIIIVIAIGLALSGQFIYPNAILADVIDFDSVKTGLRREAIYYGMQNTLQKFSFALSSVIFGTALAFGATSENPLGIRLIGPIAGFAAILGFLVFVKWYKLPDSPHLEF